jgi:outer membrane protein assembly complex protein YaeT
VCLAFVLWFGVCLAQQPDAVSPAPQGTNPATQSEPTGPADLSSLQGLKVGSIRIDCPAVEHPEWLLKQLPQKADEPLDKYKVRESVQFLYNTGKFAEIQVEAIRSPQNELVLTFSARENYFFGAIRSQGAPSPPTDNQLVSASKLTLGEQFSEEKIKNAFQGMQRALQENGYYQAKIQPFYEWDSHNQQVKVLFSVTRGVPARVGNISVTGSPGMSAEEAREVARLHPGDKVTAARLSRALRSLRKHYQNEQRLEAQVTLAERSYDPETNLLDYTFDITGGPVVDVKVEGAKLRKGKIKKLVPVYEENAVDPDLLNEGARNLRDYFQTQGYFDVEVGFTEKQVSDAGRRDVVYTVQRNQRHKFVALVIKGNKYFRREDLRERMQMQPAGGLLVHGLFSQSILSRDIQSIQNLYINNGFLRVKISPAVDDNYEGKQGQIGVTLNIDEGPQTTVGKLTIEGNSAIPTEEVRGLISATEGQPYSDVTLINDQTEVMDAYFNRGFPNVRFDYTTEPEPGDASKMDVTYKISEGAQVFVDRLLISGLHYTKPFVVEREMRLKPGDPISQEKMLDSQRRLYDMGIFNEVNMSVQNPEGDATRKNVNFDFSEGKRYNFNYGAGVEVQTGQPAGTNNPQGKTGASPRVSFDVTRLNFRGRDHTITLKTRYGNLEKLGLIGYQAPRWFDSETLTLNFTSFYEQTNNVKTFTAKRLEGSAEIRQNLDKATTLSYRLIYRRVSTDNLAIDPNLVPLFSQPVRVGMPDFAYVRDTRDNPIESRKGAFNSFDVGTAAGIFGSQTSFTRVFAQNSTYYQFHKRRWVFARSTRIGIEQPFGQTDFAPLPERFFAGGSTTHRGFGINQAGPRDLTTGFPLGGEAMFINNFELRTPPLPLPWVGNNVSAVVFHDFGNIFSTASDMVNSFKNWSQPDRSTCFNATAQNCNFNYMSQAVGGGIRYRTPIGPISFDLGYNVNPPAFPIAAPTDGSPPSSQVLRHFNFFFNIGQTF